MGAMRGRVAGASLEPALRRLSYDRRLEAEALSTLRHAILRSEVHPPESAFDQEPGEAPRRRVVLRGWGARCRPLADGRRQIFTFLLPGDIVGGHARDAAQDSSVALTSVETVELGALCASLAERPAWVKALIAESEAVIAAQDELLFDHIVRLGQNNAIERVASLVTELDRRLAAVGLSRADGFDMPLKQEHLAEALGLTLVHVNRTLQRLRTERLMDLHGGKLKIIDRRRLLRLAGLDASLEFDERAILRREMRPAMAAS